ncbi:peptidase, S41 family, partial [gut metagenome]
MFAGCREDQKLTSDGTGIKSMTWQDRNYVEAGKQKQDFTFFAEGNWTADCKSDWLTIDPQAKSGGAGKAMMRMHIDANTGFEERTSTIEISVEGFGAKTVFDIIQKSGSKGEGVYTDINKWIFAQMDSTYLWNEPVKELVLDYSLDYKKFLTSLLDEIGKRDNINREDGEWKGQRREYYYTMIQSNAPVEKGQAMPTAVGSEFTDAGFNLLKPTILGAKDDDPVGIVV